MKNNMSETTSPDITQEKSVQSPKTDRRVRRTRALLQQSLIRLMAEKEIKDITVKELTNLAGSIAKICCNMLVQGLDLM